MRPSLVVSLLLLSFLLHGTKAIRLEKGFMQVGNQKIHEKEKNSLIEKSNGGFGDVVPCKEGHCTGMTSRKFSTVTTSTSTTTTTSTTTSKNEENGGENKANNSNIPITKGRSRNGEVGEEHEKFTINASSSLTSEQQNATHDDHYVDIMDYSPARRKPPIHN